MKELVSILTVNYNGKKFLEPCFDSLYKMERDTFWFEIIMVDNLSKDDSVNFIKNRFPEIKIIENNVNNYTKALNLGIRYCKGDYVVILNNDTTVDKNWLIGALEIMNQDKKIGAVQSKILFSDRATINSVGVDEVEDFYFRDIGFEEKDVGKYETAREIRYFTGGSVILRRTCLENVGEFDEDFVMFMEDIDYSIRCRDLGWKIFYSPKSIVYHRYHGTASSDLCEYFCSRNRFLLLGKRYPLKLAKSIKTSHFFLKNELDNLHHSLLQATKKLVENSDTETAVRCLDELEAVMSWTLGPSKACSFFSQLEVVLGLRKIRIGIYDHAFHFAGGGQKYIAKIAELFQDKYEITFITNKDISLSKYKEWFDIDISRCKLKIIKLDFFEKAERYFIDEGMVVHEENNPFDTISKESSNYDIFINANMLGKVKPLSSASIFVCHFPDRDKERFFAVDRYDYIITNSDYGTFWLKQKWGLDATLRLYPSVDMYNKEGGVKKEKIIISVARFELGGSKKQLEMVKAFGELCRRNPNVKKEWRLILAGGTHRDNPYFDRVREEINTIHADNIELMPNLKDDELRELYKIASIFWHACGLNATDPHLVEHFGMTTVEAMQNDCVPIVIDGGGQKEIVEHGISGFRFKTIRELQDYTLTVMNDGPLREKVSRKAFERSHCFTSEIFEEHLIEFITNIENRLKAGEALEIKE
ncbi:glycosyltransferase [Candidatus Pacearchaeota archaeon]|jgi:GT2 family glycosyltransferase|nr:glycosyltransferase [Candidatus Pacearchaeota archaeon]